MVEFGASGSGGFGASGSDRFGNSFSSSSIPSKSKSIFSFK